MSARAPAEPGSAQQGIRLAKILLTALLASLAIAALVAIALLVKGDFGETEGRILVTTLVFVAFSGTGLAAAVQFDRRAYVGIGFAGVTVSLIAAVLSLVGIWGDPTADFVSPWATASISAVVLGCGSLLLLLRPRHRAVTLLLGGTLVSLTLAWAVLIALTWMANGGGGGEAMWRLFGVLGVFAVFGTLGAPILNKVLDTR